MAFKDLLPEALGENYGGDRMVDLMREHDEEIDVRDTAVNHANSQREAAERALAEEKAKHVAEVQRLQLQNYGLMTRVGTTEGATDNIPDEDPEENATFDSLGFGKTSNY